MVIKLRDSERRLYDAKVSGDAAKMDAAREAHRELLLSVVGSNAAHVAKVNRLWGSK